MMLKLKKVISPYQKKKKSHWIYSLYSANFRKWLIYTYISEIVFPAQTIRQIPAIINNTRLSRLMLPRE